MDSANFGAPLLEESYFEIFQGVCFDVKNRFIDMSGLNHLL